MLLESLQFRPWRRGRLRRVRRRRGGGSLVVLLVTAGITGGVVLAERPAGPDLSPAPAPAPASVPASVPATVPADPVASAALPTSAPPVSPPATSVSSVPVRSPSPSPAPAPAPRPDPRRWIASSAPLAASRPVRVEIAAVGVTAPIGPLGLNRDGTLQVPADFARAGWYTGRPTPGETGPAIIVAHRASRHGPGAFWRLPEVQQGEAIVVTRADGRHVLFTVDRVEQHRKDSFPTAAVYGPIPETALRLITCGGPFEPALGDHYRDNVIVFAHMIGWAA